MIDGEITIFDGIEFNDSLRWIDTASEIAFLCMDLHSRNAPQYANRALMPTSKPVVITVY